MEYDVIIIGGGVIGCSIARFISRYNLTVSVLEKHSDICSETSKANSGIVHAGYDPVPGSLKARMNVKGNAMLRELAPVLGFDLVNNGAMVLAFNKSDMPSLEELYNRGVKNGVEDMKILDKEEILAKEPNINPDVYKALWCPTSSIVCPFSLTISMAENAIQNGVTFHLSTKVNAIEKKNGGYIVRTKNGDFNARAVINAAGLYAGDVSQMIGGRDFSLNPRRGEYVLLDRSENGFVRSTLFHIPSKEYGKGVLVTPTVHGNILVGPNAEDISDNEAVNTTAGGLEFIQKMAKKTTPSINYRKIITSFAGLRAHPQGDDFIIEEDCDNANFFNVAGIESPGLSCSAAIGEYVSDMVASNLRAAEKKDFVRSRNPILKVSNLSADHRSALIKNNPLYGNIICRCEEISEGEIIEAIRRPLGARSLDAVKRRVRAGMGRCQGGFCSPKVMSIISRETGLALEEICKNDKGSEVLL